jgi:hypothetical protein
MSEGKEIEKALCGLLAEIADREKKKAIQNDDYGTALIAGFVKGLFKEAEKSIT